MRKLFFLLAILVAVPGCRDASKWVRRMGFTPLQPPSGLLAPGAIIMRHRGFGPVRLLCTAEESLGTDFAAAKSRTIGGRFKRSSKAGWRLSADALKQVKVAAKSNAIKNVYVQVDSPFISFLTDTDVLLAAPKRSAACTTAMRRRAQQGWQASLVVSAIRADVSYSIEFDDSADLSVEAKLAHLQAVSATLGGNFNSTGTESGSAKGLTWGFKDDVLLAAIGGKDSDVVALLGQMPAPRRKRQSLLINEEVLTTSAEPTPTDEGPEPAWGVTTQPVAPLVDDKDGTPSDDEPEFEGFIPTDHSAPLSEDANTKATIDDEPAQKPTSPRARRRPIGDVPPL